MSKKHKGDEKKQSGSPYGSNARPPDATGLPEELKPQDLPKPDGLRELPASRMEPGSTNDSVMHPKDAVKIKKKTGGCGCLSVAALLLLIPAGLIAVVLAWSINQFEKDGFDQQQSIAIKVEQSPEENTLFLGISLTNDAPVTAVETAYVGGDVVLSGIYTENVYVRGVVVHCTPGSVFEKDLEVYALSLHNEGQIAGELKGQIVRQKGLPQDP